MFSSSSTSILSPHPLLLHHHHHTYRLSLHSSLSFMLPFPFSPPRILVLRAASAFHSGGVDSEDPSVLRRPLVSPSPLPNYGFDEGESGREGGGEGENDGFRRKGGAARKMSRKQRWRDPEWVDWEDQILEETVPLVGFVRTILHSGKYESGDRLDPEHEKAIVERLLAHHPQHEKKIGCGIDFITIGYHPDFETSRCLFIVRKDGELVDFSYWKCIKSFIRKKYPMYADSFILRHFRRQEKSY